MLKIAVCDDEKFVYSKMENLINQYKKEHPFSCETTYFSSGELLLASWEQGKFDLLFLDIEMPILDGIQTAQKLNVKQGDCKIIMLTGRTDRFKEAFKIGAFRFITKPIEANEVFETLDDVRILLTGKQPVELFYNGKSYLVPQKKILYVTSSHNGTIIYTEKEQFFSEFSLNKWEELLNQSLFFRCHKTFLVNLGEIIRIEKDEALLRTGEKVQIARRRMTEFKRRYMAYDILQG